ncbi:hypothetical protein V2J09_012170 [Rumex salicifolius]
MGNPKLRFSEFIPNSWFHKPKPLRHHHQPTNRPPPLSSTGELPLSLSPPRKSYHFTRNLIAPKSSEMDSPRKSSKRRIRRKPIAQKSNPSEACNHMVPNSSKLIRDDRSGFSGQRKTGDSVSIHELRPIKTERDKFSDLGKKIAGSREAIDDPNVKHRSSGKFRERRENGCLSSVNADREESSMASSVCSFKEQGSRSVRRSSNGSPRIRIRIHSPRLARLVNSSRVNLSSSASKKGVSSKSLAVVKASSDPERDFMESMMEMIVENNIRASKDLEELLACYLSLNSDQYHDVIIQAFTHIWFHLNNIIKHIRK